MNLTVLLILISLKASHFFGQHFFQVFFFGSIFGIQAAYENIQKVDEFNENCMRCTKGLTTWKFVRKLQFFYEYHEYSYFLRVFNIFHGISMICIQLHIKILVRKSNNTSYSQARKLLWDFRYKLMVSKPRVLWKKSQVFTLFCEYTSIWNSS